MFKALKKRWYVVVVILIVVGFIIFRNNSAKVESTKETVHTVKRETIKDTLSISGFVDAHEKASLKFQSSGKLVWVGVKEGDYVNKHQAIASLDQQDIQKRMQKYLNTYMQSRLTFDQSKDDTREVVIGGLTQDQRRRTMRVADKTQYDLNNAVIDVELQKLSADDAFLSSPIEGIVTKVDTPNAGINITPASAEFVIVNPKSLYFSGTADQTEVVKLKQGMYGSIVFDSFPDDTASGMIDSISFMPKEGETGTVYEIKINVSGADLSTYRLGMTGDADFTLHEKKNVLSVPVRFVRTEGDKQYVWKMENNKQVKRYVKTGVTDDTLIEVTSGLREGDIIYDKTS
ncbi:MAG: hypothetical protein RI947_44 [Candidatus Parcubacteria bacterium]|jgi:RND family efflux transporter MFP subunit